VPENRNRFARLVGIGAMVTLSALGSVAAAAAQSSSSISGLAAFGAPFGIASLASSNGNGNGNSSNGNGNGNGNSNTSSEPTATPVAAATPEVAPAPTAGSASATLSSTSATFTASDGALSLQWTSGGEVQVIEAPIDLASTPGPAAPDGLHEIKAASLQLTPVTTPNGVNLIFRYTDADRGMQAVSGGPLRLFYYTQGQWVELPTTLDTTQHTVTVSNLDVSAFAAASTRVALMG